MTAPVDLNAEAWEEETCPDCGGEGIIVTCHDDTCVGQGYCMHGDGECACSMCEGEGTIQVPVRS